MTGSVPDGGVRLEQNFDGQVAKIVLRNKVLEKGERGKRIVKGIVPGFRRCVLTEIVQPQRSAEVTKRVGFFIRPGGAGELEGIDPGSEGVAGEGAQESFLGSVPVGDDGAATQLLLQDGPQREEGRGVAEVVGGDAVNFPGGPGDVLIAMQEGDEGIMDVFVFRPSRETDLDRGIGFPFGGAGGLEINGSEDGVANLDGRCLSQESLLEKQMVWNQLAGAVRG
jgi:hypothetical protein